MEQGLGHLFLLQYNKVVLISSIKPITSSISLKPISGRMDKASATETVDLGSIPSWVKVSKAYKK